MSLSCQSCSCSPSSFDVMSSTLRLTVSDRSLLRIFVIHAFAGLTPSLFQFPLGLIFSFFWSSWHGVSFRFSVTYCFTWLGAYGSFIPFSISGFGSRILSLVFTVFLCICQRSTVFWYSVANFIFWFFKPLFSSINTSYAERLGLFSQGKGLFFRLYQSIGKCQQRRITEQDSRSSLSYLL